jgi:uncharacterized SAM-binding protein YcdF (DUF218 family)
LPAIGELRIYDRDESGRDPKAAARLANLNGANLLQRSLRPMLFAFPLLYFAALSAAGPLFEIRTPITPVDVIVVLGGDGPARAAKAARVYRAIASARPQVLVTGDVDCLDIANLMIDAGVPARQISVECASADTWENAKFSRPLLQEMGARSGILVSSWFHMRRALACFQVFSPEIHWGSAPVERRRALWEIALHAEGIEAVKEYLKVAWYAIRWPRFTEAAAAMALEGARWPGR